MRFDRSTGELVADATPTPRQGESWTQMMERINREQREAESRQPMLDIAGNPWLPGSFNLTNQMRIINRNPTLAAELRRQAGLAD